MEVKNMKRNRKTKQTLAYRSRHQLQLFALVLTDQEKNFASSLEILALKKSVLGKFRPGTPPPPENSHPENSHVEYSHLFH